MYVFKVTLSSSYMRTVSITVQDEAGLVKFLDSTMVGQTVKQWWKRDAEVGIDAFVEAFRKAILSGVATVRAGGDKFSVHVEREPVW